MAQDNDKASMTLRIPRDLDEWLLKEAGQFGIAKNSMIVMLLQTARKDRTGEAASVVPGAENG